MTIFNTHVVLKQSRIFKRECSHHRHEFTASAGAPCIRPAWHEPFGFERLDMSSPKVSLTCLKVEGLMGCPFDSVQGKGSPLYVNPINYAAKPFYKIMK